MARYAVNHLVQRGRVFYFRKAVPVSLIRRFGRAELKVSLATADPAVAKHRCRRLSSALEGFFEWVNRMPDLSTERINDLLRRYFERCMQSVADIVYFGPQDAAFDRDAEVASASKEIATLQHSLANHTFNGAVTAEVGGLLESEGIQPSDAGIEVRDALAAGVLRARIEQRRLLARWLQGIYGAPEDPLFHGISLPLPGTVPASKKKASSVLEVIESYIGLKLSSKVWVGKTLLDNRRVLGWFEQLAGPATPIDQVDKETVRRFRDGLLAIPANFIKLKNLKSKTFPELLSLGKQAEASSLQGLAPKTARKYFGMLNAFLNWCADEGHLEKNPAGTIQIEDGGKAIDARLPFSKEQLKRLFSSPQYTGHFSAARRHAPGAQVIRDGKYWIPLVALFSGMRLGEIVQLLVSDVRDESGTPYFQVCRGEAEDTKTLKTESSERVIPIHSALVKLGFLAYVDEKKAKGSNARLFPDINPGKDGYYSHNFSKYFSRYLKAVHVKTPRTTFHSFRHNFTDALRLAQVEDSRMKALLGHSDSSVTSKYGSKWTAAALANDVEKINYGLDLTHLIPQSP